MFFRRRNRCGGPFSVIPFPAHRHSVVAAHRRFTAERDNNNGLGAMTTTKPRPPLNCIEVKETFRKPMKQRLNAAGRYNPRIPDDTITLVRELARLMPEAKPAQP